MSTRNTPGPWTTSPVSIGIAVHAVECMPDYRHEHITDLPNGGANICIAIGVDRDTNARLIAAAPELLAACEAAECRLTRQCGLAIDGRENECDESDCCAADIAALRAAIAKAKP